VALRVCDHGDQQVGFSSVPFESTGSRVFISSYWHSVNNYAFLSIRPRTEEHHAWLLVTQSLSFILAHLERCEIYTLGCSVYTLPGTQLFLFYGDKF
jgi:hypothetical protein